MPDIDVKFICLTRKPPGLLSSFQKNNKQEQKPKSTFSTLVYYCYTILTLRIAGLLLGRKICFVQYEYLLESPVKCIEKIGQFIDIDLSVAIKMLEDNKEFDVGHIVTGNRLRKNKRIRFNSEKGYLYEFSLSQKLAMSLMNIWKWMMRF